MTDLWGSHKWIGYLRSTTSTHFISKLMEFSSAATAARDDFESIKRSITVGDVSLFAASEVDSVQNGIPDVEED